MSTGTTQWTVTKTALTLMENSAPYMTVVLINLNLHSYSKWLAYITPIRIINPRSILSICGDYIIFSVFGACACVARVLSILSFFHHLQLTYYFLYNLDSTSWPLYLISNVSYVMQWWIVSSAAKNFDVMPRATIQSIIRFDQSKSYSMLIFLLVLHTVRLPVRWLNILHPRC